MKKTFLIISFLFFYNSGLRSQLIDVGPDITVCTGPVTLTAVIDSTALGGSTPPAQLTLTDDEFSGIINFGFSFTFYGNTYTQCVISSNNFITFDLTVAGAYSAWTIVNPCPNPNPGGGAPASPLNAVMGPWQDILPPVGGTVSYQTLGTAPNRIFVVEYCNVPMFSCTGLLFSSQIILKESSNEIETHIINKPLCTTWNAGQAIHGLHNFNGTIAHIVPGRNAPTQWTTANEGYKFIPTSPSTYSINNIPFLPIMLGSPTPPIVVWYIAGNPTPIDTGISITVNPASTTTYVGVLTSNACAGLSASDTMTLFIGNAVPIITGSNAYCGGDSVLLGTTQPYSSYLWSTGDTTASIYVTAGAYNVYVIGPNGCDTTSGMFNVALNSLPTANLFIDNPYCLGDTIILDASATTILTNIVAFHFDLNNTGPYEVNTPDSVYNATSSFLTAGNYTINMIAEGQGGCIDTISAVVQLYNNPVVNLTTNPTVCIYDSADFNALAFLFNGAGQSSTITNYAWDFDYNGTTDASGASLINVSYFFPGLGTYPVVVTVTSDMGCVKKDTVQATYVDIPDGNIIAPPVCGNIPANFTFNNTGLPISDYYWDFGNLLVTNDTSGLAAPNYLYPTNGSYTVIVIVSTSNGCLDTMITGITIAPLPAGNITNSSICEGDDETFNFQQTSTDSIVSYFWTFPTGTPGSSTLTTPTSNFNSSGIINVSVIVTNQAGCLDTIVQPFLIRTPPLADFGVYPICISRFTFDPMVIPDSASAIIDWNLGDGTVFNNVDTSSFNHIYLSAGDFNVTLVITNQWGCQDSITQLVQVDDSLFVLLPNVLVQSSTLGNDKIDFEEMVPGFNLCIDWTYTVFDRWGLQMFESHNDPYNPDLTCENCFKGMAQNGVALTPGIYFYIMKGNFNLLKSGFITIFE